jgi:hypothetical protein
MTREEKEAYEWYLDRVSMPTHPIPVPEEENVAYNREHPLPSEEEIQIVLREAGY